METPEVCTCHHSDKIITGKDQFEEHYHTPGGIVNTELAAVGLSALPFRPGKTSRDKKRRER